MDVLAMTEAQKSNDAAVNIVRAVTVMRHTYRELSCLIGLMDERFQRRDLQRHTDWLGLYKTGAQLSATDNWMAVTLSRLYMPSGAKEVPTNLALVVEAHLAPENFNEPVLALVALKLAQPTLIGNFFSNLWAWKDAGRWFFERNGEWGEFQPDINELRREFSSAERGVGRLVPMCSITRDSLEDMVVNPAMVMMAALAEGSTTRVADNQSGAVGSGGSA